MRPRRGPNSVDLANTVLAEQFRQRYVAPVPVLLAQVRAVDVEHERVHGRSITGDRYTDAGDGLGPTTETLRAKFAHVDPHQRPMGLIPSAGGAFTIRGRRVRSIVRRVVAGRKVPSRPRTDRNQS